MENQTTLKKYRSLEDVLHAQDILQSKTIRSNYTKIDGYDPTRSLNPFKLKLKHPFWILSINLNNKDIAKKSLRSFHVSLLMRTILMTSIRLTVAIVVIVATIKIGIETTSMGEDLNSEIRNKIPFINMSTPILLFVLYAIFEAGIFTAKKLSFRAKIYLNTNSLHMRAFFVYFLLFILVMLYTI